MVSSAPHMFSHGLHQGVRLLCQAAHLQALDEGVNEALIIPQSCGTTDTGRLGVGLYPDALLGLEWRHMDLPGCLSHLATTGRVRTAKLLRDKMSDFDIQESLNMQSILTCAGTQEAH